MRLFSRKKNWQQHGARGLSLYQAGQFAAALREFDIVVRARPPRDILAKVQFQRGLCSAKLGDMTAAADAYRAAVKLDPSMRDGHFNLGKALYEQARYGAAIEAYTRAIETDPSWGPAFCNRADARIQLAEAEADKEGYERAVSDLDRALVRDPWDWIAHFNRALALQRLGRAAEAQANLEKFLAQAPPGHPYRAMAQQSMASMGSTAEETPDQKLSPAMMRRREKRIPADVARIIELNDGKNYEEACKLSRRFLEMAEAPDAMSIKLRTWALPVVFGELSHALFHSGRYDEALQVCEDGIAALPRNARLWQTKGHILGHIGRHKGSIRALSMFIAYAAPEHAGMVEKARAQIEWNRQKLRGQ